MSQTTIKPTPGQQRPERPTARRMCTWFPVLLLIAGVLTLLYPVVATQYNNVKQLEFSQRYNNNVQRADTSLLEADLAAARDYNSRLPGVPILDPWLLKVATDPGSTAYRDYSAQLNRFGAMARLRVPSVGIDLPVHHNTSQDVLAKGAGHLYGTSLPVGGLGTHAVLTSHTGLPNATLFDHLIDVKEGDLLLVDVSGETLAYRVDQIKVVLPNEIADLTAVPDHDYLTLFTCTPYGVNSHRLLVRGERVAYTPEVAAEVGRAPIETWVPLQGWMWGLIGGASLGIAAIPVIIVRDRRKARAGR